MGGVASKVNKEERVRVCKERRKLMKQLVRFRGEFADAQLVYMRALRNIGATLRQFTESDSLELETTSYGLGLPPSPPPPLPPSPPPPPPLSPDLRKSDNDQKEEVGPEESMDFIEDDVSTPPSSLVQHSSSWDIFGSYSPHYQKHDETVESNDEEKWADTKTKFDEDEQEEETVANMLPKKLQLEGSVKDNISTMRWPCPKDSADTTMILWKHKRTLESIAKELDEHFLKSSAGLKEISVLMEIKGGDTFLLQRTNENRSEYLLFLCVWLILYIVSFKFNFLEQEICTKLLKLENSTSRMDENFMKFKMPLICYSCQNFPNVLVKVLYNI